MFRAHLYPTIRRQLVYVWQMVFVFLLSRVAAGPPIDDIEEKQISFAPYTKGLQKGPKHLEAW
jgi:hypothetical protein